MVYIKVWKSRVLNFVSEEETCWCFISWQSNRETKITNIDSWKKRKVSKVRMDLQVRLQGVPTSFRQGFSKKIAKCYEKRKNSWKFVYILARQCRAHFDLTNFLTKNFKILISRKFESFTKTSHLKLVSEIMSVWRQALLCSRAKKILNISILFLLILTKIITR